MGMEPLEVNVELVNEKVKFIGTSTSRPDDPIAFDYVAPIGDGEGFLGLEMLVLSFSGCVSTAIVVILRKMGKCFSGYHMNVKGYRKENPLSLEKIAAEVVISSADITDEDIRNAIKRAEDISPVWIAMKNNVEVTIITMIDTACRKRDCVTQTKYIT